MKILAAIALGVLLGFVLATTVHSSRPVCHSKTEDSVITDCDYRNGTWYQK